MTLSQRKEATYALIINYGTEYGLSQTQENQMMGTIQCESNFDPKARGDDGGSVGLVQIDRLYWPKTTLQEAEDPDYAVSFMANLFSKGEERKWTCWREIFGV